jgi:rhamnogalacturonan endolyase
MITCDLGFQIADIDGDGRAEVLCQKNFKLYILDGATGGVKNVFELPENPDQENQFGRLNGDGIVIANFRGLSQPMDIVVKNRYKQVWAFDNEINLLWTHQCNTGHFPMPYDFDGDGKDALFVGYTLLDHNGKVLWSYDWPDHTDEIVIGPFDPARNDLQIATVSGDEGFNIFSQDGEVLHREYLGHAQRISVAKYREDLEGLQFYIKTYWGNPDILSLHDCRGNKLFEFEPTHKGNLLVPVNWTGDGIERALLNGHPVDGGMIDGYGRKVVMFPNDGHPDVCAEALDLNGDGLDEIVLWDRDRIWIYTRDQSIDRNPLYTPIRWPHWNNSNYRGEISLPHWKNVS